MGWPIVGDPIYGTAPRQGGLILHLHACDITVPFYKDLAPIRVTAPPPPHMREQLQGCGWDSEERNALHPVGTRAQSSLGLERSNPAP
jgi:tRNA pseudouridine32 synthase / 23S rRNA pseudouridine746 synthase